MDEKRLQTYSLPLDRPGIVDIFLLGEAHTLERTQISLRLARCRTPWRVVVVPPHTPVLPLLRTSSRDVVLLLGGTEVYPGWLDRLSAAAKQDSSIGTVQPFSNARPHFGYPTPGGVDTEGQVCLDWRALDRLAATTNTGCVVKVPVPGGCCIFVRRNYLNQILVGKTAHQGAWRHLLATDVCVRVVNNLWDPVNAWPVELSVQPFADAAMESFLRADVARYFRRQLDLARLEGSGHAMLLVTHVGGGGTERHVQEMSQALEDDGVRALVLRPNPRGRGVLLSRFAVPATPNLVFDFDAEYEMLYHSLKSLGVRLVHVHHVLGHSSQLRRLIDDLEVPYVFTVHDYYVLCPRISLSDRTGRHCGEPDTDGCNECLARNGNYYNVRDDSEIVAWRATGAAWLAGAQQVFVPHADVGERLARYFPDIQYSECRHAESLPSARYVAAPRLPGQPLRVVLIGTLQLHKGCEVLLACARDVLRRGLPLQFVVMGDAVNAADLSAAGVEISGEYREKEIFELLENRDCHCALFLSICSETYSYTLSIAQAAGLYTLAFDLGAQGARVRESGWGEVIPLDSSPEEINAQLLTVGEKLHHRRPVSLPQFAEYPSILQDYYRLDEELRPLSDPNTITLPFTRQPGERLALPVVHRRVAG